MVQFNTSDVTRGLHKSHRFSSLLKHAALTGPGLKGGGGCPGTRRGEECEGSPGLGGGVQRQRWIDGKVQRYPWIKKEGAYKQPWSGRGGCVEVSMDQGGVKESLDQEESVELAIENKRGDKVGEGKSKLVCPNARSVQQADLWQIIHLIRRQH